MYFPCYNAQVMRFSPRGYIGSIVRDVRGALGRVARDRAALIVILLLLAPWTTLFFLRSNLDWLWQIGGISVTVLAFWWTSRSGGVPFSPVKNPRIESFFAIALVAFWMVWRIGICSKAFFFLPAGLSCYKSVEFEDIPKNIELVVFPILVLLAAGYGLHALGIDLNLRGWWISIPALVLTLGYAAYLHNGNLSGYPQNVAEFFFAAGLPEEITFRAILLTRLEAWWRNPAWALFGAALIFGISHLPIDYLFFTSHNLRETLITAFTYQMSFGAAFAFAYQRMRNVWPIALLHAFVDAMSI